MNKETKVSVIIPVYNTEKYLRQCLDSVVNQTLRDIEIICVDDGSTDGSIEILREYEQKDSRVKMLCQKNQYAGVARNNGLNYASGEYVFFMDSDDYCCHELLERAVDRAKTVSYTHLMCWGTAALRPHGFTSCPRGKSTFGSWISWGWSNDFHNLIFVSYIPHSALFLLSKSVMV